MTDYVPPHLRVIEKGTSASIPATSTTDPDDRRSKTSTVAPKLKDMMPQHGPRLVYTTAEITRAFGTTGTKITTLNSTPAKPKTLAFILLFKDPPNYIGSKILAKTNTDVLLNRPHSAGKASHNVRFPELSHLDVSDAVFPVFQGVGSRIAYGNTYKYWYCLGWFRLSTVQYLEPGSEAASTMLQRKWGTKKRDKQRWLEALMDHWFVLELKATRQEKGENPMKRIVGREMPLTNSSLAVSKSEVEVSQLYGTRGLGMVTLMEVLDDLSLPNQATKAVDWRRENRAFEGQKEHTDQYPNQAEDSPQATRGTRVSESQKRAELVSEDESENLIQLFTDDSNSQLDVPDMDPDEDEKSRDIL